MARLLWIKVHRYLGLATLFFLLVAGVSGCILCFDHRLDAALNPDLFMVPAGGATPVPTVAVARFAAAHPRLHVVGFPLRVAEGHSLAVTVAGTPDFDQVFLDAGGQVIGTRQSGPGWGRRHIVEGIFLLHYTLLAGTVGRYLMGLAALGWLIGNGVGFYLTLPPKRPLWRKWRRLWKIDLRARWRLVWLDLHRASGLWLFVGVMVLAATSVCMNFFDEAFQPVVAAVSPSGPSPFDRPAPADPGPARLGFARALALAQAEAGRRGWGWQAAAQSYVPDRNLYGVMFTPSGQVAYRWLGPVTLYFDGRCGALVYADDPYSDSAGRKFGRALYPLHSGEVIGLPGIAIVFLLGAATVEMSGTGLYLWWQKRRARRGRVQP